MKSTNTVPVTTTILPALRAAGIKVRVRHERIVAKCYMSDFDRPELAPFSRKRHNENGPVLVYPHGGVYYRGIEEIISGGAAGADTLGARWAKEHEVKLTVFRPDWNRHGKAAGFIRNEDIVAAADMVLAIWDGFSNGTANSLCIAKRLKKPTLIIYI